MLVSGDMSVTGLGTVTYNDGKRVLAFGHPFFNLGPVDMPMSKGEVLMVLASPFQPNKMANATEIVGALHSGPAQRHHGRAGAGIGHDSGDREGALVRREAARCAAEKNFRFNVFVQQKWTPYLMMLTLFNSISGLNEFMDEATYRLSGNVEMDGEPNLSLTTMQASGEMPMPAPMLLAGWWGDKFNRLYPERREDAEAEARQRHRGSAAGAPRGHHRKCLGGLDRSAARRRVPVKVFLRPYRGERIEREFKVQVPAGLAKGEHRILLSDADTANRMQNMAGDDEPLHRPAADRFADQPGAQQQQAVCLAAAIEPHGLLRRQDDAQPACFGSERDAGGARLQPAADDIAGERDEQAAIPFDYVVSGSYSLKITVK